MPRIASTLLLALLLLGAQQGALLHEIGHGFGNSSVVAVPFAAASAGGADFASHPAGTPDGSYCEKCFEFAHVCAAGLLVTPGVALVAPLVELVRAGEAAHLPADAPQSRSRGPPLLF